MPVVTVEGWSAERGRFEVCLEADGTRLRIKPANLQAAAPAEWGAVTTRAIPITF